VIASLPMYDRPETRAANDRFWALIREAYGDGPQQLSRDGEGLAHWRDPDLVFSQTCGMPYRLHLQGVVSLVGTPVTTLDDPPGQYHSVLVTRADDPRDRIEAFKTARLAANMDLSQSGWAAPQNMAATHGFAFTDVVWTGAHLASARAVQEGRADIAAIDVVSWTMIRRYDRWSDALKVIDRTPPTPMLPYVTAKPRDAAPLFAATQAAIAALSHEDRSTLCLAGLTRISAADYLAVPSPGLL
jgi:ABC-type phosphate/phosphonate transport system substrate-binding protein